MSHDDARLARYRAGQLAPDEAEAFEIHYLDCARCRAALEEDEALAAGFKAAAEEGLLTAKPRSALRWLPTYSVAASLLLVVLAALLLRDTNSAIPESTSSAQIVPLLSVRDGAAPADIQVSLSANPELIVFVIDAVQPEFARYDVAVADVANRVLWSASDLAPRPTLGAERLAVAIPSSSLAAGRLRLTVTGRTAEGSASQPATFALLVSAAR